MGTLRAVLGLLKSLIIYNVRPVKRLRMKRFYASFLQKGFLGFDFGAHTGNRTAVWLSLGARVLAVEPQNLFASYLRRRFRKQRNLTIVQVALGKESGQAELQIAPNNPTVSSLSREWTELMSSIDGRIRWDRTEKVAVMTMDELIGSYGVPAFCKIDVEGLEAEVLLGLHRPVPALSFEFFPGRPDAAARCIDRLCNLGTYQFNWSLGETFRYQSEKWLSGSTMKEIISGYGGRRSGDIYARLCS